MASTETKSNERTPPSKSSSSSSSAAIDQLCDLIDQSTFGFAPLPSSQVKAFRSSRLKRLKSTKPRSAGERTSFSFCSSFLRRFRRLSTRPTSNLPSIPEEAAAPSSTPPATAFSIAETRRTASQSCNVEELAAYLDNYLYLPKSLSGAAELMYT